MFLVLGVAVAVFGVLTDRTNAQGSAIRANSVATTPGAQVTVIFDLESQGTQSSASFTVNYISSVLSNPVASIVGTQVPAGANLGTNVNEVAAGRIGILIDSTVAFATGTRQLLRITFNVAPNAAIGLYPVTFSGSPTPQSVSTPTGGLVATTYIPGNVQIGSTAAGVEISGRVLTPDGRGIRNATVTITDADGVRRTATTSSFGIYKFDDVEAGATYVIGVSSKQYRFTSRVIQVVDSLADFDFVGQQ